MPDYKRVAMLAGLDETLVFGWIEAGLFENVPGRMGDWVARALVIAQLGKLGVPMDVIKAAEREDVIGRAYMFELLQMSRRGQQSLGDVLKRTGLDEDLALRICEALGIDDSTTFSDPEVEFFEALNEALNEGLSVAMALELCEIWGTQMRFIAHAEVISYDTNVARRLVGYNDSPVEGAAMLAPVTRALIRAADLIPQPLHRRHLLQAINLEREAAPQAATLAPGEVDVAIGFVDLTGYTALTESEGDRQALTYARRLERIVRRHSHAHGVRIVKRLGDGFMLAAQSSQEMLTALLAVVTEAADRDDMPTARGGIAFGRAVSRAGDYFGHTVNLAARVLDEAEASEVLVTEEVLGAAERGPFGFHDPREAALRGFEESVRLWRSEALSAKAPVADEEAPAAAGSA